MDTHCKVTIITVDADGAGWPALLSVNDALLAVLRFARKNPQASCTIELREQGAPSAPPLLDAVLPRTAAPKQRNIGAAVRFSQNTV